MKDEEKQLVTMAFLFPNGMVATFGGPQNRQISELQGKFSDELFERILARRAPQITLYGNWDWLEKS